MRPLLHAAGITAAADQAAKTADAPASTAVTGLPLVDLLHTSAVRTGRYWVTTTINDRGRLADRTPLKVLGWPPGTRVTITTVPAAGTIAVRHGGADAVTRQGHLRLPADIRHACRLRGGDRLLVVTHPADSVLVAYTPAAVEAMISAYHAGCTADDDCTADNVGAPA